MKLHVSSCVMTLANTIQFQHIKIAILSHCKCTKIVSISMQSSIDKEKKKPEHITNTHTHKHTQERDQPSETYE